MSHDLHGVGIGFLIRARNHTKITVLRIDRPKPAIFSGLHPGDVIPDGCDFPSLVRGRRNHHGEVRLAAGGGKRRSHVGLSSLGILNTQDQHVLRQPSLVTTEKGSDAQGEAFLSKEGVAPVSRTDRNDLVDLGKVADVSALWIAVEHTMGATVELLGISQMIPGDLPHPGHDPHVQHNIDGVGQLNANLGQWGSRWSHEIRNDKKRPALHGSLEESTEFLAH